MVEETSEMDVEWIEEAPTARRRISHIRSCCAEGCKSKGYRLLVDGERVQYFPFPMYDFDLCNRWASALQLEPLLPYEKAFVCSKHFRPSDYKARLHDESKKTLRRTAIPSLEPVVGLTPANKQPKKKNAAYESSEDTEDDDAVDLNQITTILSKKSADGDGLAVLLVKDPNDGDQEADGEVDIPPIISGKKKLPLICDELLSVGPPYPWRKIGLEQWVTDRMTYHEEHLQKTRDCFTDETLLANSVLLDCQEREQLLALIIIKKGFGRLTLKNYLKAILD